MACRSYGWHLLSRRQIACRKIISDAMYQAFINGYRLVEVSHGRPYYVYCVELFETDSGICYFSERRYSEFSTLHRTLKKDNTNIAPFPPKRVRNSQPKVLEQRREALEVYIQKMLKLPVAKQQVLNFLGIEGQSSATSDKRGQKETHDLERIHSSTLGHHPVLTFHYDPYVHVNKNTSLPDIVTNGVLLGLYKSKRYFLIHVSAKEEKQLIYESGAFLSNNKVDAKSFTHEEHVQRH